MIALRYSSHPNKVEDIGYLVLDSMTGNNCQITYRFASLVKRLSIYLYGFNCRCQITVEWGLKTNHIVIDNFTDEKGKGGMARLEDTDKVNVANASAAARDLGQGWKVNPYSSSVCIWHQSDTHNRFPKFPAWQALEVN